MSGAADTSLAPSLPGRGDDLRGQLMADYEVTYERTIRGDTLDALVVIQRWLDRRWMQEDELLTTVPSAAREIGWPVIGVGRRDGIRFRNSLTRRLDMLVEMGWIESWDSVYDDRGSGEGILVRSRRDSSVGRALLRPADQRRLGEILDSPAPALARAAESESRRLALAPRECQRVARRVSEGADAA